MALILNIETATQNCSVAVARDRAVIACRELSDQGYAHAEKLHVFIKEVLDSASVKNQDLDAIAISRGPGSYTGLRIGVSAAKGLCYALGIPMISIDTLKTLASQVKDVNGLIVPMLDARRMEVYSAVFSSDFRKLRETRAEIITEESFSEISQTIHFVGDANTKVKTLLNDKKFVYLDQVVYPSARDMALWSQKKFEEKDFVGLAYFEPDYLKDFLVTPSKK